MTRGDITRLAIPVGMGAKRRSLSKHCSFSVPRSLSKHRSLIIRRSFSVRYANGMQMGCGIVGTVLARVQARIVGMDIAGVQGLCHIVGTVLARAWILQGFGWVNVSHE